MSTNSIEVVKTVFRDWLEVAARNPKVIGYNLSVAQDSHLHIELLFKNPEVKAESEKKISV